MIEWLGEERFFALERRSRMSVKQEKAIRMAKRLLGMFVDPKYDYLDLETSTSLDQQSVQDKPESDVHDR
jgi:hypothetical protein